MVDFQWHPTDPFTMVSVSEHDAGGTLQLWRINDLIYMTEEEALDELDKHRCVPAVTCAGLGFRFLGFMV